MYVSLAVFFPAEHVPPPPHLPYYFYTHTHTHTHLEPCKKAILWMMPFCHEAVGPLRFGCVVTHLHMYVWICLAIS